MNERLGNVSFPPKDNQEFSKPYSDSTAQVIDDEVRKLVSEAYERTKSLLQLHIGILKQVRECYYVHFVAWLDLTFFPYM